MPEVRIRPGAPLALRVGVVCVPEEYDGELVSSACAVHTALDGVLALSPFRVGTYATYWAETHVQTVGASLNALTIIAEMIDTVLDSPIANWRQLSEEKRLCWLSLFNQEGLVTEIDYTTCFAIQEESH